LDDYYYLALYFCKSHPSIFSTFLFSYLENKMNDDIENLLNKWYSAKQELSQLEKKIEKYKVLSENLMNKQNTDEITSDNYTLKRKELNRTTIGKKDLPEDIWERYSKELFYNAFYISKKGDEKKLRKSVKKSPKKVKNL